MKKIRIFLLAFLPLAAMLHYFFALLFGFREIQRQWIAGWFNDEERSARTMLG
jgi:hypothetical protein